MSDLLYPAITNVCFFPILHQPPPQLERHPTLRTGTVIRRFKWLQRSGHRSIPHPVQEMIQVIQVLLHFRHLLSVATEAQLSKVHQLKTCWIALERQALQQRLDTYYADLKRICRRYHILLEQTTRTAKNILASKRLKVVKYRARMPYQTVASGTIDETKITQWLSTFAWNTTVVDNYAKDHYPQQRVAESQQRPAQLIGMFQEALQESLSHDEDNTTI